MLYSLGTFDRVKFPSHYNSTFWSANKCKPLMLNNTWSKLILFQIMFNIVTKFLYENKISNFVPLNMTHWNEHVRYKEKQHQNFNIKNTTASSPVYINGKNNDRCRIPNLNLFNFPLKGALFNLILFIIESSFHHKIEIGIVNYKSICDNNFILVMLQILIVVIINNNL